MIPADGEFYLGNEVPLHRRFSDRHALLAGFRMP